jgi:hypothetical protein
MNHEVLEYIERKREGIKQIPFLAWVQDRSIEPRYRFGFAPSLAPMTLGFADLMKLGLRDLGSLDPNQKILNAHTLVDDHHWQYFLQDLNTLAMNQRLELSDALRLLWGDHCAKARQLIYTAMGRVRESSPILRLVILEMIEVAADEGFRPFREVGEEFTKKTGKKLLYFGQSHQDIEDEHEEMGAKSIRATINAYKWTPAEVAQAKKLADEIAERFHDFGHELLAYAKRTVSEDDPFWPLKQPLPSH